MNPPYSKPGAWIEKFHQHGNGVALLAMSKSQPVYALWHDPRVAIVIAPPDIKFVGGGIYMPTLFVAMGASNIRAVANLGAVRMISETLA